MQDAASQGVSHDLNSTPGKTMTPDEEKVTADTTMREHTEADAKEVEPVQLQEKSTVSGAAKGAMEKPPEQQNREGSDTGEKDKSILDSEALYTGEVEIVIPSWVELRLVSRLYSYLLTIPDLRILYTKGSWNQGTIMRVGLEKPIPLISIMLATPGVTATPELAEEETPAIGKPGFPPRGGEQGGGRIKLTLKEA